MALRFKLRSMLSLQCHSKFSTSILNPDSKTVLGSKGKSRAALNLLRTERNPEQILEICRAASLTPESQLDRIAYSKAIFKLKDLNYLNGIREFLEESKNRPDMRSERSVSHIMVLYGQAGMCSDAVKTFEEMHNMGIERNVKTLNSLLFACLLAKDYAEMKRIYLEFPKIYGITPNLDVYNTVIKGLCGSGEASAVYSILSEMDDREVKPNATTFGLAMEGFYREEKFEDVGKITEMMERYGIKPGIGTYNIRIQALCKLSRSKEAEALFEGILSMQMKPNHDTYNHLIFGFCKEGDLEKAKGLFNRMVESGIQPQGCCYFTLVYFSCRGGDFESAFDICKKSMAKGWFPNFSTMKLLVEGLASNSKAEEARDIIRQLKEKFPSKADVWSEIEEGLAK